MTCGGYVVFAFWKVFQNCSITGHEAVEMYEEAGDPRHVEQ